MTSQPKTKQKLIEAFVGKSGKFYVLRQEGLTNARIAPKYMVRSSIEAYNNRKEWPECVSVTEAMQDFDREATICPQRLIATLND
jgi:hypothetical protein